MKHSHLAPDLGVKKLVVKLESLLLKSARVTYRGHPDYHPIVVINSLKNLIGDGKENPSSLLLDFGEIYLSQRSIRKRDKMMLSKLRGEGISESVFVIDLEDAILDENMKKAEIEAAKLFILADSPQAILEGIIRLILQNFERFGRMSYHTLRAFAFGNVTKENSWYFIQCILKQIKSFQFINTKKNNNTDMDDFRESVLASKSERRISRFNAAYQLFHSNYVRTHLFQNSISNWNSQYSTKKQKIKKRVNVEAINQFRQTGGDLFIKKAEHVIGTSKHKFSIGKKLIFLDSLRMLCKKANENELKLITLNLESI
jgi:hypothetical protein